MKEKISTILIGLMFIFGIAGVYAYDSSSPYTVTMNFIVGADTSFTVALAGAETTIDFNPSTSSSKEVEPDSQNASTSTPIATITNTGNVAVNFTQKMNETNPTWVNVSYSNVNVVNWSQTILATYSTINTSVASSGTSAVYMWANFTSADSGTTPRIYQINSTAS